MWPFRKKKTEKTLILSPAEPESPRGEWSTLPALPLVLEPLQLTIDTEDFEPGLSTRRDQELFLAPLEHEVSEEESGLVEGLMTVVTGAEEKHEPKILDTVTSEQGASHPLRDRNAQVLPDILEKDVSRAPAGLSVSESEAPVVSLAPPPARPKMTTTPESEQLLPPLDLRSTKPDASQPDPDLAPSSSEPLQTSDRHEPADSGRPTEARPTLSQPPPMQPRKLGLGEPISHKPVTSSVPGETKEPLNQPEPVEQVTPRPEPELPLPPTKPQQPGDFEVDRVLDIPQVRRPDEIKVPQPKPTSSEDAKAETPNSAVNTSRVDLTPKPRFTPRVRKSEVRPTLAGIPSQVQRRVAESSPGPTSRPTPAHPVPERHSPPTRESGGVIPDLPGQAVEAASGPMNLQSEPPALRPVRGEARPLKYQGPGPAPTSPISRAAVDESSTELPTAAGTFESTPQRIDSEMPVAKIERPQVLNVPARSAGAVVQEPISASAASVTSSDIPSTPPEPPVSIQRETTSPSLVASEEKDEKDGTDSEADEIYEKVRIRLRKELRMYREQAGLHTYRG